MKDNISVNPNDAFLFKICSIFYAEKTNRYQKNKKNFHPVVFVYNLKRLKRVSKRYLFCANLKIHVINLDLSKFPRNELRKKIKENLSHETNILC